MARPEQDKDAPQDGAGIPDGFRRLWMPHRMAYIKGEGKPVGTDGGDLSKVVADTDADCPEVLDWTS